MLDKAISIRFLLNVIAYAIIRYAIVIVGVLGILIGLAIVALAVWAFSCLWMLMPEVRL